MDNNFSTLSDLPCHEAASDGDLDSWVLEYLPDAAYVVDTQLRVVRWNKAAERLSGYSAEEIVGHCCEQGFLEHTDPQGKKLCGVTCPMRAVMSTGKAQEYVVFLHHRQGYRVPVRVRMAPVYNSDGEVLGAVQLFSGLRPPLDPPTLGYDGLDAIDCNRLCSPLSEADLDPLLGIANRRYGLRRLEHELAASRINGMAIGVLFLDLDDFKHVNDHYGHAWGDVVLQVVARTVQYCLRESDLLIRWGGDEFVIVLPNASREGLITVAQKIVGQASQSFVQIQGERVSVSVSLGGHLAAKDDTALQAVERADLLMYQAKRLGKNCYVIA